MVRQAPFHWAACDAWLGRPRFTGPHVMHAVNTAAVDQIIVTHGDVMLEYKMP
jgi:hypothetical protein